MFIGRPDAEAGALILCHVMQRADLLEKNLMQGKIEGKRKRGQQRMRWLDSITDSMVVNLSTLWERTQRPSALKSMGSKSRT